MLAQTIEQTLALVVAVAIGLVERDDERTLGAREHFQCIELALRHVAIDDEHDEIDDADDFERELLARLAVELVDAGRVDQMHAAARDFAPCALRRVRRRAVQHADRNASSPSSAFASADLPTLTRPNTARCTSPRSSFLQHRVEPHEIAREVGADRGRNCGSSSSARRLSAACTLCASPLAAARSGERALPPSLSRRRRHHSIEAPFASGPF